MNTLARFQSPNSVYFWFCCHPAEIVGSNRCIVAVPLRSIEELQLYHR